LLCALVGLGLVVGILTGLFGVGGGVLFVPLLPTVSAALVVDLLGGFPAE